jgi:N-glycosylase/DNA lyase
MIQIPTPADFSFDRTVRSHGWFDLPPFAYDRAAATLRFAYQDGGRVVAATVRPAPRPPGLLLEASTRARTAVDVVRSILRLDEDLRGARAALAAAPALRRCVEEGGGRLLRAPTVFEDVAKMLCTINCSWALTRLMVGRLVEAAGAVGPGGARAFPGAAALAAQPAGFFREVVRAGYRAPFFEELATRVAQGQLDLEGLRAPGVSAEDAYARLRSIKGIGPYAADNLMRLLGHHDLLGLDSWCRARYLRLYPRTRKAGLDAAIARRYGRFAPYRGLALWLDLTRSWHDEPAQAAP